MSLPRTLPSVLRSSPELNLVRVPSSLASSLPLWLQPIHCTGPFTAHSAGYSFQLLVRTEWQRPQTAEQSAYLMFIGLNSHVNIHIWLLAAHTQALLQLLQVPLTLSCACHAPDLVGCDSQGQVLDSSGTFYYAFFTQGNGKQTPCLIGCTGCTSPITC